MALRCFLFCSDEGSSDTIRQVMTGLGIEGESCQETTSAVAKLAEELFQIVVVDWDQQPEAAMLLSAARDRKPAERPLTLAIVSDDASVPKALQAGANSILKKPLVVNQVTDTLTTARDLLRSRQESAHASHAAAAAAAASAAASSRPEPALDQTPHAGNTFQSTSPAPGGQFETDSEVSHFPEQSAAELTDPLKDLEPVASAVPEPPPVEPPSDGPKGLEWYLKARGVVRQPGSSFATSTTAPSAPPKEGKPELLGYDQAPSAEPPRPKQSAAQDQSQAATHTETSRPQVFSSYVEQSPEPSDGTASRFRLGKGAIAAAVVLAALAVAAAPQAPWHSQMAGLWSRGRHALHGWLNPQPVTSVSQAPTSHENFARPGDEYKLPVAENIPDATTDPSQINVVPVIDPTAKKPTTPDATATDPVTTQPETIPTTAPDPGQPSTTPSGTTQQAPSQPIQSAPQASQPAGTTSPTATEPPPASHIAVPAESTPAQPSPAVTTHHQPAPYVPVTTKVPSSLQSQMATMTPEASGNKPAEAALPAIEPVSVPELTERALLADQPPLAYPASAAGKQGTVTLQVLIGRDGTVQDAKFLQGSLAFARSAIEGVKRWKFKPYSMNGRAVSVATTLTLRFAPGQ
jgi:TonB family protein